MIRQCPFWTTVRTVEDRKSQCSSQKAIREAVLSKGDFLKRYDYAFKFVPQYNMPSKKRRLWNEIVHFLSQKKYHERIFKTLVSKINLITKFINTYGKDSLSLKEKKTYQMLLKRQRQIVDRILYIFKQLKKHKEYHDLIKKNLLFLANLNKKKVFVFKKNEDFTFFLWSILYLKIPTRLTRYNETHNEVDVLDPAVLPDGRIVYRAARSKDGIFELWTVDSQASYVFSK